MVEKWTQAFLEQEYIKAKAEEGITLEYKAAGALEITDSKKKEITKDISAFANAGGGIVIYGIKEYDDKEKRHLPERLDPIDRIKFSREWLGQVINNIRPRIEGLQIHPISVNEDKSTNKVVYLVKIPQSTTAHQATDLKYYRRYNFERLAMFDHEIRDVMNRGVKPNAEVEFAPMPISSDPGGERTYKLRVTIKNQGLLIINHYKLEFSFPDLDEFPFPIVVALTRRSKAGLVDIEVSDNRAVLVKKGGGRIYVSYRSGDVLFPDEEIAIDEAFSLEYLINDQIYYCRKDIPSLEWTLYADSMLRKQGSISFSELCKRY